MSFIERFGLGALFVLCGLILIVGIFGEDDVAAAARNRDKSAKAGIVPSPSLEKGSEWNNLRPITPSPVKIGKARKQDPSPPKGTKVVPSRAKAKARVKRKPFPSKSWRVRRGDSLARIAQRSYGRQGPKVLRFLAKANHMKVQAILKVGRIIKVPALPRSLIGTSARASK